ncbi:MAG TPA: hypothetical protein VF719_03190, partial [Abditibacteriaceae bacterium]
LDPKEDRTHLELTAILWELMNMARRWGPNVVSQHYLATSGKLQSPELVQSDRYRGNAALRYIAMSFAGKILDGTYPIVSLDAVLPGAAADKANLPNPAATIEKFAKLYLASPKTGDAGFNESCLKVGLMDNDGRFLTLKKVRDDLYRDLAAQS